MYCPQTLGGGTEWKVHPFHTQNSDKTESKTTRLRLSPVSSFGTMISGVGPVPLDMLFLVFHPCPVSFGLSWWSDLLEPSLSPSFSLDLFELELPTPPSRPDGVKLSRRTVDFFVHISFLSLSYSSKVQHDYPSDRDRRKLTEVPSKINVKPKEPTTYLCVTITAHSKYSHRVSTVRGGVWVVAKAIVILTLGSQVDRPY